MEITTELTETTKEFERVAKLAEIYKTLVDLEKSLDNDTEICGEPLGEY